MEKKIYWFLGLLVTGTFCISCSEIEDGSLQKGVTKAELSLNLIAPNGVKVISNIAELKQTLSKTVETLQNDEFEIVSIDFFPLVYNYCAKIVYLKSDGKVGCLAISDFRDRSLENSIRMKTRSESGGTRNVVTYCKNRSCPGECSIEFEIKDGELVLKDCVCDEGNTSGKCVKKTKSV